MELDESAIIKVPVLSREEAYPLPAGTIIKGLAHAGSSLVFLAEKEENSVLALSEYSLSTNGQLIVSPAKELSLATFPFEGDAIFYDIVASRNGNFYLLVGNDSNGVSDVLTVQQYSSTWEPISVMNISSWDMQTVDFFAVGNDGELVLVADDKAFVYHWSDGLIKENDTEFQLRSASSSSIGIILSGWSEMDHSAHYFAVNAENGQLTELDLMNIEPTGQNELSHFIYNGSTAPCQSLDAEYLINDGNAICQVDFENNLKTQLIEWNPNMNVNSLIGPSCRLGETEFACVCDGKLILATMKIVEKRESGIVRVGIIEVGTSQTLSNAVERMNTVDVPYTYKTASFSSTENNGDMDKFRAKLAADDFDLIIFFNEVNTGTATFEDL